MMSVRMAPPLSLIFLLMIHSESLQKKHKRFYTLIFYAQAAANLFSVILFRDL